MKLTSKIATTLAVLALASTAHAALITGVISFDGQANLNGTNATATAVNTWTGVTADIPITGDFASVLPGTPVLFNSPWAFNSGLSPLWSVGGFTFDLTSSSVLFQSNFGILVAGTGVVSGNGFDPTPGTWSFSTQTGQGSSVRFSASTSTDVPDGGATLALLGVSFLGLGGVSRLVRRK